MSEGNILVVDDMPESLNLLSNMLTDQGYEVCTAQSGEHALCTVMTNVPDLILLYIRMPGGMDGFEVCSRLKLNAHTRHVPIIYISSKDDIAARLRSLELGGVDFIGKPFWREEMLARVRTHMALSRIQRELELSIKERHAILKGRQYRKNLDALRASLAKKSWHIT